ncbi:MAG: hypothetical protein ACR652_19950, partial [Methylocystis sp.]|uniref:hypothetical protein n=1 Tax=Methylocystis sp. TaxID=1911079 RepID=UPI003DA23201
MDPYRGLGNGARVAVSDISRARHPGVVRGVYDGTFDRTNLPDEIVLTNYFSVRDGQIVSLVIVFNQPAD